MREVQLGWEYICKYSVNYRWNGLTGRYGCGIIDVSRGGMCRNLYGEEMDRIRAGLNDRSCNSCARKFKKEI